MASSCGHAPVVLLLLSSGADVQARTSGGQTPLHYTVRSSKEGAAAVLLTSCWQRAVQCRKKKAAPYGTRVHAVVAIAQASKGHAAVAQELLKHGADVLAKDATGSTPLHRAAAAGARATLRASRFASPGLPSRNGGWPGDAQACLLRAPGAASRGGAVSLIA